MQLELRRSRLAKWMVAACLVMMGAKLGTAQAQSQIRDIIGSFHLGAGYAAMLNVTMTPDLSAASYRIRDADDVFEIDILRLPYEGKLAKLRPDTELSWRFVGGYFTAEEDFQLTSGGGVATRWRAYSVTGGLVAKIDLGKGITLAPGLDLSLARLTNDAAYSASATALQPFLDGLLFNWHADAYGVTPSVALAWKQREDGTWNSVRTHAAWSRIKTFNVSDELQSFDESVGVYSVRAEYGAPSALKVADRVLNWFVSGGMAGFFGANRRVLGFAEVAELGGGVEIPLQGGSDPSARLRLSASVLRGTHVTGWAVGLGMAY